jgi:molecular chaperone GrpE (heat shock protein)
MSNPVTAPDEFATAMQQLSAEAGKKISAHQTVVGSSSAEPSLQSLTTRLDNLESVVSKKFDELIGAVRQNRSQDLTFQFRKIEEQLTAIRSSETVNQKLFDSLHDELLKYRDNFVHESLQKPFIHDLLHLFDDLNSLLTQLRTTSQQKKAGTVCQWRDNLENSIHALIEVLHRLEVTEVEPRETVDRTLHRVVSFEPTEHPEEDGVIIMRLKRGFFWRGSVLRPEEVIAKRFG